MTDKLGLDIDEVVILQETSVAHGGVMALYTDELILTNKKIICLHKGMFGGTKQIYHYPLDQIKVFNGIPQVRQGKLSNGTPTLAVYLLNGEEQFNFQSSNKKTIENWTNEVKKLFGCEVQVTSDKKKKGKGRFEIEDDSVLGAFKEVGDEFKEVGREFASAFGIKMKDKSTIEDDDQVDNDAVNYKYQMEDDEIILLSNQFVGVFGDVEHALNALLLTNKRIVLEYTTGFFNNQYHICHYELNELKKYNDVPQAKLSKHDDEPVLETCFQNAHLYFEFDDVGNKKKQVACIEKWVKTIAQAVSKQTSNTRNSASKTTNTCKQCGAVLDEGTAFCTSCGARVEPQTPDTFKRNDIYVCRNCGAKLTRDLKFCTECGTAVTIEKEHVVNEEKVNSSLDGDQAKSKLPLEQQIELLQKLKALVDAGILSQEEFEFKKKEIL